MGRTVRDERDQGAGVPALPKQTRSSSTARVSRPEAVRRAEERGRPDGEPLQASWRPPVGAVPRRPRRRGLGGVLRTYGWRIYVLPILLVLTALVVFDTVRDDGLGASAVNQAGQADPGTPPQTGSPSEPEAPAEVTERPPGPVDVNVPTAELPNGGPFTAAGARTFHIVPGTTERIGTGGRTYTYTIEVEDGIDPASYGGDEAFGKLVDQTFADPRGWTGDGRVQLQRIDSGTPTVRISLTTPETVHRPEMCGYSIRFEASCYRRSEQRVMINLARWVRGAVAFGGDMITYRQYALNHEVGHVFNNGHVGCQADGALAPVMMQQSFGVANDFVVELNRAAGFRDPLVADGKACRPNAWPNPQAQR